MTTTRARLTTLQPSRQGGAALEFAIVLPVLMTLALGVVDYGRIFATSITLRNAARIGAEQGATHRLTPRTQAVWENRLRTAVLQQIQCVPQFDSGKLVLSFSSTTNAAGLTVVDVSVQYPFETIVDWPGVPHTVLLAERIFIERYR